MPEAANVIQFDTTRRRKPRSKPKPAQQQHPGLPLMEAWQAWKVALDARNTSSGTLGIYHLTVKTFGAWLAEEQLCGCSGTVQPGEVCPAGRTGDADQAPGIEYVTTAQVRKFLTHERQRTSPGTAHKHFRNLRNLFNWLIKEGERATPSPVDSDDEPHVPKNTKQPLTDDEIRALLAACKGDSFEDRRDTAIIRTLLDNGVRVSGLAGLRYTPGVEESHDVFISRYVLRVVLKGGDTHWAPIGKKTAAALDRYVRARARRQGAAESPWLWLGLRGRLKKSGIQQMLERRGEEAGIPGRMHPHRFRRTMADSFLDAGGDPLDLMRIGGWKSLSMVQHYTEARADARALKAHARLSPGDRF